MSSSLQLISATRHDSALLDASWNTQANDGQPSAFMLLRFHFDRLKQAIDLHAWSDVSLSWPGFERECTRAVEVYDGPGKGSSLKVRPSLSRTGTLTVSLAPVPPFAHDPLLPATITHTIESLPSPLASAPPLTLFLDTNPTPPSLFTRTKTSFRDPYTSARDRFSLPHVGGDSDVLLWCEGGNDSRQRDMVMETTVRNVAFFRGRKWITPADGSGCLSGVMRRYLVESGLVATDEEDMWAKLLWKDKVQDGEMVIVFNAVEGCRLAVVRLRKS